MADITKLPKWAQEHIKDIQRQRDIAVRQLNKFCDNQTESRIFVDDAPCTGEGKGPKRKRHYIQSDKVAIMHKGVQLEIICREHYINIHWGPPGYGMDEIAFIPDSYQSARLVSKENMR